MNKTSMLAGLTVLGVLSSSAETVIANLGSSVNHTELDTQALGVGINASNYATFVDNNNTATTFTFIYDLSGLGLGAADTLEIAVTASANLTTGGAWGLSVQGGANDLWYDVGETLSFDMAIKESGGGDITATMDTFSFSGFSAKGLNRDLNGEGDPVTVTLAGQNLSLGGVNTYYERENFSVDLSAVPVPYRLNSVRSGQDDILQLGQLQFEVIPEPGSFALLSGLLALGAVMVRRRG